MGFYCVGLALVGLQQYQDAVEAYTTAFENERDDRQQKEIQRCLSEALELMAQEWEGTAEHLSKSSCELPRLRPRDIPTQARVMVMESKAEKLFSQARVTTQNRSSSTYYDAG